MVRQLRREWTLADTEKLEALLTGGLNKNQIAEAMGRARQVIHRRITGDLSTNPSDRRRVVADADFKITIPPEVLAERDRRLLMQPRDLTGFLMGDPIR